MICVCGRQAALLEQAVLSVPVGAQIALPEHSIMCHHEHETQRSYNTGLEGDSELVTHYLLLCFLAIMRTARD